MTPKIKFKSEINTVITESKKAVLDFRYQEIHNINSLNAKMDEVRFGEKIEGSFESDEIC